MGEGHPDRCWVMAVEVIKIRGDEHSEVCWVTVEWFSPRRGAVTAVAVEMVCCSDWEATHSRCGCAYTTEEVTCIPPCLRALSVPASCKYVRTRGCQWYYSEPVMTFAVNILEYNIEMLK